MVKSTQKSDLFWSAIFSVIVYSNIFLPFRGSPNDLPKMKFVESTVFEIVESVGTKYLCTERVKVSGYFK